MVSDTSELIALRASGRLTVSTLTRPSAVLVTASTDPGVILRAPDPP
jgi:hypothetical protein